MSELPIIADESFTIGFFRRGDDDESAWVMAVDDFFHDWELLTIDGTGEGETFFSAEAADTFIEGRAAIHGFHDFTCDVFVLR